jgi:hypothetical protein
MVWLKWTLFLCAGGALVAVALTLFGAARWKASTGELSADLESARQPPATTRYDAARELAGLPAPVQRYFRAVLQDGQPLVTAVHIEHHGSFNLGTLGTERWRPFTSTQRVTTQRPGFVWDGRVAVLPALAVLVHDAYIAGEGRLHATLLGLVSLTDQRGHSAEPGGLAQGEFLRYFAETAWYPTALLPSQGVRWSAVDEHAARATMADGPISGTLLFQFNPATGFIDSVRAEARGRSVGDAVVPTPWEGRWSNHAEHAGLRVPMRGEVAWLTPQGRLAYWRGEVAVLRYEFAP